MIEVLHVVRWEARPAAQLAHGVVVWGSKSVVQRGRHGSSKEGELHSEYKYSFAQPHGG